MNYKKYSSQPFQKSTPQEKHRDTHRYQALFGMRKLPVRDAIEQK
jgi:hypothetical protein